MIILRKKLFARGVVSAMNPIFKNKTGASAVNRALKNNVAVQSGGWIQNRKQEWVGPVKEISGADLPKGGLLSPNHPSKKPNFLAPVEQSYIRNKGTRIEAGRVTAGGTLKSMNDNYAGKPTLQDWRFKDKDAVSQLRTGRAYSKGERFWTSGRDIIGKGPLATTYNRPTNDQILTSPNFQKQANISNLHEAINTRKPGDLLGYSKSGVIGNNVNHMKHEIAHTRAGYMNPIKQLFGGERKIKSQSLTQLFK